MSVAVPNPKLTVVSRSFPPQVSGSAILLANLLSDYKGTVTVIAGYGKSAKSDPGFLPPCPTRYLNLPRYLAPCYSALQRRFPHLISSLLAASIVRMLRRMRPAVVLGVFPADDCFVAAFRAARYLKLPFFAHMHDLWQENMDRRTPRGNFAAKWEPVIIRGATRLLCMTEAMQDHYQSRYGIRGELLPHCIHSDTLASAPREILQPSLTRPTVLFVGNLSREMNHDALRQLAAASELLPPTYELLFCSPETVGSLGKLGIKSSRLRVQFVSRQEVQALQSEAHVLVAPLSHKNGSPDEVRTVFSTKLLEYLVAGRPILVFAPADSFHARSARAAGWGYVVSEDDPRALADGILKVVEDQKLAASLVRGARAEAEARCATRYSHQLQDWVLASAQKVSL